MLTVVVDTNIFIDALFYNDVDIIKLFKYEHNRNIQFITCEQTVKELNRLIKRICKRLKYTKDQIFYIGSKINYILARSKYVNIGKQFPRYCEDSDDDKFIECGKVGQADYILSSDGHIVLIPNCTKDMYKFNFKIIDILDFVVDIDYFISKYSALQNSNNNGIRFIKINR